jgi:ribosomal protein L40E
MEKKPPAVRTKHDTPICEKCQDKNIVMNPNGSYRCRRCGFDSAKGR